MASDEKRSGISVQTLVISALAAVAAAVIVPTIWERGTLLATAMTPVIVALVSEALNRPAQRITAVSKTVRRSGTGAAVRDPDFDPLPPGDREVTVRGDDPFGLRERPKVRVRHHWKLALATGVAAFAIAVVALTASELVLGGPATKQSGRTTFIGGGRDDEGDATPTATPSVTQEASPEATPTPTATATSTVTPAPTASPAPLEATPTPTVTP